MSVHVTTARTHLTANFLFFFVHTKLDVVFSGLFRNAINVKIKKKLKLKKIHLKRSFRCFIA